MKMMFSRAFQWKIDFGGFWRFRSDAVSMTKFCRVAEMSRWRGRWHGGDVIGWRQRGFSGAVYGIPRTAFGAKAISGREDAMISGGRHASFVRQEYRFSSGSIFQTSKGFWYWCAPSDLRALIQRLTGDRDGGWLWYRDPGNKPWLFASGRVLLAVGWINS